MLPFLCFSYPLRCALRDVKVDAHNIVPVWEASPKLEVGARTIRKKIHDRFADYLVPYPEVGLEANAEGHGLPAATNDWDAALAKLEVGGMSAAGSMHLYRTMDVLDNMTTTVP